MLELDNHIKLDKAAIQSPNLCDKFDDKDLQKIGEWCWAGYEQDKQSRHRWESRMKAAMNLAMQLVEEKNFPWPNCANVAFPLVTIGALQFHARAYPAVVNGTDIVRCRVIGEDPNGAKKLRAERISCHMSYQVLEQDKAWEEQHDRLLINLPIVGSAFKKSYVCAGQTYPTSDLVLAQDLVMNYYAKSVESCARKTHLIPFYRNDIYERVKRGTFRDVLDEGWYKGMPQLAADLLQNSADRRKGQTPPSTPDETTPFTFLEQHNSLDLDGDGYAEPYIITIERDSKCVVRIVTRFDREEDIERNAKKEIIAIRPVEYFTKYSFIPSPDGGIYDVGFGMFLGPLNESVNTIINQLLDAGTMGTAAGGFLGRGARIRGGVYTFSPFEWKRVDSTVDDLNKAVFPLPVREPSAVLFQLLSLLINYCNRISASTDIMVGEEIGQNTPAETARTMAEEGRKIYGSIFKRVWRGMKEEFKKRYLLNALYMPPGRTLYGTGGEATRDDYLGNPDDVVPAADPNVTSDTMDMQVASAVAQRSQMVPGYDKDAVEKNLLRAMRVAAPEALFKGTNGQPPAEDPRITLEKMKQQGKLQELQADQQQFVAELMSQRPLLEAQIIKLQAEAFAAIETLKGDEQDRKVALINAQLGAAKLHREAIDRQLDVVIKHLQLKQEGIKYATARLEHEAMGRMGPNGGNGSAKGMGAG